MLVPVPSVPEPEIGLILLAGTLGRLALRCALGRYRRLRHPLVQTALAIQVGTLAMLAVTEREIGLPWLTRVPVRVRLPLARLRLRLSRRSSSWA